MNNNHVAGMHRLARCGLLAAACLLGPGCESPLVLDEVEKALQSPLRRTDNFQALSAFQQNIVAVGSGGVILASQDNGNDLATPGNPFLAFVPRRYQLQ